MPTFPEPEFARLNLDEQLKTLNRGLEILLGALFHLNERIQTMSNDITELRTEIIAEIREAIAEAAATHAAELEAKDAALAEAISAAGLNAEQRDAVQRAFDEYRAEVQALRTDIAAPGILGADQPEQPGESEGDTQTEGEQPVTDPEAPAYTEPEQPTPAEPGDIVEGEAAPADPAPEQPADPFA